MRVAFHDGEMQDGPPVSATTRSTARIDVSGKLHSRTIFDFPWRYVASPRSHVAHRSPGSMRPAHAVHHSPRDLPVRRGPADRSRYPPSTVTSIWPPRMRPNDIRAVERARSWQSGDRATLRHRSASDAPFLRPALLNCPQQPVFRLEKDLNAIRDAVRDKCWNPDAQVHEHARLGQFLGDPAGYDGLVDSWRSHSVAPSLAALLTGRPLTGCQ